MEKFVRRLSAVITAVLLYGICAYSYLTFKGFEYQNGHFELISQAYAQPFDSDTNGLAAVLPSDIALNLPQTPIMGEQNAPLTLYEFSSFGCSHCAAFHLNILPRLEEDFIKPGKLKIVFVSFPLDKKSMQAAMLSECVSALHRKEFIELVFLKQREWMLSSSAEKTLGKFAEANGLSADEVQTCLKDDKIAQEILSTRQESIDAFHIQGTPAFLISGNGQNEIIYGVPNYDELVAYLNKRLQKGSEEDENA